MSPTASTSPRGVATVVVVVVCPGCAGRLGFHARDKPCPASWTESDVIVEMPVFETWRVRSGPLLICSKSALALKWCVFVKRLLPPVWTAMSV